MFPKSKNKIKLPDGETSAGFFIGRGQSGEQLLPSKVTRPFLSLNNEWLRIAAKSLFQKGERLTTALRLCWLIPSDTLFGAKAKGQLIVLCGKLLARSA